jgi:SHS2 domain-containing protein
MKNFTYLDHTADVIVHAWGESLSDAFANSIYAMFAYMTNLESVNESSSIVISADFDAPTEEHILFNVLDEFLFSFMTRNYFIVRRVEFSKLDKTGFEARAFGEEMNIDKHERGTEIKAITMHGMSVVHSDNQPRTDTRFLLDI